MKVHGAPIQIIDLPGIIEGAKDGKGRGRQVYCRCKNVQFDLYRLGRWETIEGQGDHRKRIGRFRHSTQQEAAPTSLYARRRKVVSPHTNTVPLTKLDHDEVKAVLSEYRISNADVSFRMDANIEELIDVIEGNRIYILPSTSSTKSTRSASKNSTSSTRSPIRSPSLATLVERRR